MNSLDLIALLPVCLSAIRGFRKGFIISVFSFLALIVAVIALMKVTTLVMLRLEPYIDEDRWLVFTSYLITFIGAYALVMLAGKFVEKIAKVMQLSLLNKVAGSLLAVLQTCFLLSLGFWLGSKLQLIPPDTQEQSVAFQALSGFAPGIIHLLISIFPAFRHLIEETESLFDQIVSAYNA